jgi:hypothetical protein
MHDDVLFFMHIPKTAGTTMHNILFKQYKVGIETYSTYPFNDLPLGGLNENVKCVIGHNQFGFHKNLNKPFRYFTLLRNPVDRVISDYYFSLAYHKLSFESYLKLGYDYKDYNPNEMQVRYATGNNSLNLELAIKNLERYFPVVGITERFSESAFMMKQQFGWGDISYLIENVNNNRPVQQENASIIQEIKEKNQLDIQLYHWAMDRLNQQIDLLNKRSTKDLNSFILSQSN